MTIQVKKYANLFTYEDINKALEDYNYFCKNNKKDFVEIILEGANKINRDKNGNFISFIPNGLLLRQKGEQTI